MLFRNALIHTRGIAIVAEVSSSTRRQVKFGTPSRPTALVGGAGMADVFVPTRSHEIERLLNDLVNGITDEAALQRFRELVSNFTSCDEPRGQGGAERKIADAVYTAVQLDPSQSMDTEHRRLEWSAAALFSSGFSEILAETLLRPLSEELGTPSSQAAAMAYLHQLDKTAVRHIFDRDELFIDRIVELVASQSRHLVKAPTAGELSEKFAEEAFTLNFGSLDTFFSGLEGLIGAPSPDLRKAMSREHCHSLDSQTKFITPFYVITTSSETEWWYVADPENGLEQLQLTAWPIETANATRSSWRRGPALPLKSFADKLNVVNAQLGALDEPLVAEDELLAGRLYTGEARAASCMDEC